MESLISEFTFLSDLALLDKSFDPSSIEDLMKLFEVESYKAWAAAELDLQKESEAAEKSLQEAEEDLDRAMESATDEFKRFEEEMERLEREEYGELVEAAERERRLGKVMESAATLASKRYIEAAMRSAADSMRSAWRGVSGNKVHPS